MWRSMQHARVAGAFVGKGLFAQPVPAERDRGATGCNVRVLRLAAGDGPASRDPRGSTPIMINVRDDAAPTPAGGLGWRVGPATPSIGPCRHRGPHRLPIIVDRETALPFAPATGTVNLSLHP